MIRRQVGNELWLITQNDHAILSGQLAEHFGGNGFAPAHAAAIRGIALHDCGWPLHDDQPTLNQQSLPLDVFETPRHIGIKVWTASAERAAAQDAYAGLLVSLHSLALSVMATTPTAFIHEKFDLSDPTNRFEVNKFQQAQVELQERLRRELGLRVDQPRQVGLIEHSSDPSEQQLVFDFRLLQAMDKLSLGICCTKPPAEAIEPLPAAPGHPNRPLRLGRSSATQLIVAPWPFKVPRLSLQIPFRRLPAQPWASEAEFRVAYSAAPMEWQTVELLTG